MGQRLQSFYLLVAHGGDDSFLDLSYFSAVKDSNNNSVLRRNLEVLKPLRLDISTRKIASNLYGIAGAPSNLNHLKTLALTSCNVLDVYDYNNVRAGSQNSPRRVSPDDQVSARTFPGINWWKATRYNAKGIEPDGSSFPQGYDGPILLGYNYPVQQILVNDVLQNYRKELARLRGQVGDSVLQQYAWLKANAQIRFRDFNGSPRNACAWDAQYYYYISYTDPGGPDFKFVRIPLIRIPGFLATNPPSGDIASPRQSDQQKNGLPPAALEVKIP